MEGRVKIKNGFFSKTAKPILMNKIYVVVTRKSTYRKKFGFFWIENRSKKCFPIFNFFLRLCFIATPQIFIKFFVVAGPNRPRTKVALKWSYLICSLIQERVSFISFPFILS